MVSFRKLSMAFAGFALAGSIASAAVTPIVCTVSASSPAIKLEGLTEPIGDINLACKLPVGAAQTDVGGAPGLLGTFQVQTDGPQFTNTLADKDARTLTGPVITVGAAASAIKGKLSSDGKSVTFNLIDLAPLNPANAGAVDIPVAITITGLKINAQQSQGNLTSPKVKVSAISYNDANKPISLVNETQSVGTVQQAVNFGAKTGADRDCNKYDGPGAITKTGAAAPFTYSISSDTLKTLAKVTFEANFPNSLAGAQLTARFAVPSGAKLYVATSNVKATDDGEFVKPANKPFAVNISDPADIPADYAPTFKEIKANDDGIYEANWYVQNVNTGTDTYVFPVYMTIPQNFVTATTLSAVGSIGPFSTVATATDSSSVPAKRFVVPTSSKTLVSVGSCSTTLLFPYVTNVGNWDTGIAITNPTADMKDADGKWVGGGDDAKTAQSGTCTLYFVGDNAPAKAIKSGTIAAGKTLAFLVSAGNADYGIAGVPGMNGYLKVSCTFSEGRGFAFMSSSDLGGVGVGYVAEKGVALVP